MTLCRLMQDDFKFGTGRFDAAGTELYSDRDLQFGIAYAEGWIAEGYTYDKTGRFDMAEFRDWCKLCLAVGTD